MLKKKVVIFTFLELRLSQLSPHSRASPLPEPSPARRVRCSHHREALAGWTDITPDAKQAEARSAPTHVRSTILVKNWWEK
jgi:hypothetical protein